MTVHEITPAIEANTLLPGAQFADAFRIEVNDRALNARQAAERTIARQPRWAEALVTLRNILMTPFGLKTSGATQKVTLTTLVLMHWLGRTYLAVIMPFHRLIVRSLLRQIAA
jgi:hypothetical protein